MKHYFITVREYILSTVIRMWDHDTCISMHKRYKSGLYYERLDLVPQVNLNVYDGDIIFQTDNKQECVNRLKEELVLLAL